MTKRFPFLQVLGALLLALALGILLAQQLLTRQGVQESAAISEKIRNLLPEGQTGTMSDYSEPEMPVLQVDGTDYVCLLEIPALGLSLPIEDQWNSGILVTQPSRFWGSIYDGTLILGGSNQAGYFDFCAQLDVGVPLLLTDMQGTQFRCRVETIQRSSSADFEKLADGEYPLTLFVREQYENRYIIVRCEWDY